MKKLVLRNLWIVALLLCCPIQFLFSQQIPAIPIDPDVRIGMLDNGLTYYIRKNNLPAEQADFYIAQKVGSIQEESSQSGLAHFLEHMCFNGTTHFPGNSLKEYLERIGVKFGENLNAYTSVDETVYNISNVPVRTEGAVDSCLLILHDWSNDLTLDPVEIDKERGVINEEWRTRMSAQQRLLQKVMPTIYAGTKYEDCFPIGDMEVVMNFPYQTLRDYYEKWYRPDLQAIIVVGEVDVDEIESKIKEIFADIPAQPDAAKREYYPVNDNQEPIVVIAQDKEQPYLQFTYYSKHDATPREQKESMDYLVKNFATQLISYMINTRLEELRQQANPPYIQAGCYESNFLLSQTKDAFAGVVRCKEDAPEEGIRTLLREIERARRFGFTEGEYNRARTEYLRLLESAYNERDKRKNEEYVDEYVRHFLDNEPIPSVEEEYTLLSQIAPSIPVEVLNQLLQELTTGSNEVLTLFAPEKEGLALPTEAEFRQMLAQAKAEELTAYVDQVSDEPLMAEIPEGGKILSETTDSRFGTTNLTLSNGVRVILKQTDFKADEIVMKGVSLGGTSLFPDSEAINMKGLGAVKAGGLGNFNAIELEKVLTGKMAYVGYNIENMTESVSGSCSPKDFETMMQLTYLTFTAPRWDEEAFASFKNRNRASLQNMELNPRTAFSDSINSGVYMNHPRRMRITAAMIDQMEYDKIFSMYQDRYRDASDFTFIFVGNIDMETMKPLIETYIGALPAIYRQESFKDNHIEIRPGLYENIFYKEQETPRASNFILFQGSCPYNLKTNLLGSIASEILRLIYTEKVREDEGGSYGVSTYCQLTKYPTEKALLQINFETAPEKREKLMEIIYAEAQKFAQEGPAESDLNKVKEFMLKKQAENLKENDFWLECIDEYLFTGTDFLKEYEETLEQITLEEVQKFMEDLLNQHNRIEISMISAEKE